MKSRRRSLEWDMLALSIIVKLLLTPAYRSTDFEVHRNWLATTSSLPMRDWYYEATSEWTLDYPPFFAWFEYLLSWGAEFVDPAMLDVKNLNYASPGTVFYQRLTVIVSDLVYWFASERCAEDVVSKSSKSEKRIALALLLFNPGLLFVDSIHFQYNGFLSGVLLLSIHYVLRGNAILGGGVFAALLNFKHIYLYVAPVYFVHLLRHFCFVGDRPVFAVGVRRLALLGAVVLAVFGASFGPMALSGLGAASPEREKYSPSGVIRQIFRRLFPFKRGLCHAYWAPNVWAIYAALDRALLTVVKFLRLPFDSTAASSNTRGLVGDITFAILPGVSPAATLACTVASQLPALVHLWHNPGEYSFLGALVLCAYGSFLFGWHVHEKAILLVIIPFTFIAMSKNRLHYRLFIILTVAGYYSLFPLLFQPAELPIKASILALYGILAVGVLGRVSVRSTDVPILSLFPVWEKTYLVGFVPLFLATEVVPSLLFSERMSFLPLMIVSVYTAIGFVYCWMVFYWSYLSGGCSSRRVAWSGSPRTKTKAEAR